MKENDERNSPKPQTILPSVAILATIVSSIFLIETGIMLFRNYFPSLPDIVAALLDSVLIVLFACLILYYFWYRPIYTSLSKAENAFIEEEEKLRVIANSAQDAIVMMEGDGTVSYWNPAAEKIFGFTRKEALGKPLVELIVPPPYRDAHNAGIKHFQSDGKGKVVGKTVELKGLRKNGEIFPLELSLSSIQQRKKWRAVGLIRDISERKRIEEEHVRLVTAVEQAAETIMITDRDGTILYVNAAFEKITGYSRDEVVGKNPNLIKSNLHEKEFYQGMWETLSGGNTWKGRFINKRKDEKLYEEEATISPIMNEEGEIVHFVAVKRDITHEIMLEKQLNQKQKLESIGRLAGGIAHDFNNILAGILGYTELARRSLDKDHSIQKNLDSIIAGGNRAKGLVQQILSFSRKSSDKKEHLDFSYAIRDALLFLRHTIPRDIEIVDNIGDVEATVFANPAKVHQIIINLCTNAAEAMTENGGIIYVSLSTFDPDKDFYSQNPDCKQGEYLKLTIRDTGTGIGKEIRNNIFEPFLSTKGAKNTGLGLSIVHGNVIELGGAVTVEETSEQGTTFAVFLPKAEKGELKAPRVEEEHETPGKGERILIVDDEDVVLDVQAQILRRLNYQVTCFSRSKDALEAFTENPDAFDLVITDQSMPELTGERMSTEMLKLKPGIPIILCTGFSNQINEETAKAIGIKEYLTKPVVIAKLSRVIRKALE